MEAKQRMSGKKLIAWIIVFACLTLALGLGGLTSVHNYQRGYKDGWNDAMMYQQDNPLENEDVGKTVY